MFYGPIGHLVHDNRPMNYAGHAAPNSGILWGHVTMSDSLTGIRGAKITRTYNVRNGMTWDSVYTDELGNFMWIAIDSFHYNYKLTYVDDSGRGQSYTWKDVSVKNGKSVKLLYSDPAPSAPPPPPPPPDTNKLMVNDGESAEKFLHVVQREGMTYALISAPTGTSQLELYDVMGRKIAEIPSVLGQNVEIPIETSALASGTYYVRLATDRGKIQSRFSLIK
jgi:hypothetical protein